MSHFFHPLMSFIIALFFILLGIIGVIIPWSPGIRTEIIQFILDDSLALSLFGFAFIVIGSAIAANTLSGTKRRYYSIRSNPHAISVDETVIQQCINAYWKELFPENDIPSRLSLKNNTIHITADLPYFPLAQQQLILKRIEQDLSKKFNELLGYHDEFHLSASFQSAPTAKTALR